MNVPKTTPLFPLLLILAAAVPSHSQETTNAAVPPQHPEPREQRPGRPGPMANLSESERQQLKAAHDQAIQQNPALGQALQEARQTMEKARKDLHDAMIAIDPSVAPILAKMAPSGRGMSPRGDFPKQGGESRKDGRPWQRHGMWNPGMASLSESERQQLKSLHQRIKDDPSVVEARNAKDQATTPEAHREAEKALRDAAEAAMIKLDPSAETLLRKMHGNTPPPPADQPEAPEGMAAPAP
jgi:hypothetical protein